MLNNHPYAIIKTMTLLIVLWFCTAICSAQPSAYKTILKGTIIDSLSKQTLPMVTLQIQGSSYATLTSLDGEFNLTISSANTSDTLLIKYLGYKPQAIVFKKFTTNEINITLQADDFKIDNVVVKGTRKRYVKKGNPAFELAQKLIKKSEFSDPKQLFQHYDYQRYEKILFSLDDFDTSILTKKLAFLSHYQDTSTVTGRQTLPISLKERVINSRIIKNKKTEVTIAKRSRGIDEKFSQENIETMLELLLDELDLFKQDIYFLKRYFVGPISPLALSYYKYYLNPDTISYQGVPCVELSFYPYSKESLSFSGKLYVTADSSYFIRRAELTFPNAINVNYIQDLTIIQDFDEGSKGQRILVNDDMNCVFRLISKEDKGVNVSRLNSYRGYKFEEQEPTYPLAPPKTTSVDDNVWALLKNEPADKNELKIDEMIGQLRKIPLYRLTEWVLVVAEQGYIELGRKSPFDIGPISSFIGGNTLEGTRLQFGGTTTPFLCKRLMVEGLGAYGTRDKKYKYNTAIEYSFNDKKRTFKEFPVHSLRAEISYDVHKFGRVKSDASRESIFSWAKRSDDSSLTYMRNIELNYTRESKKHFSIYAKARHYTQTQSVVMQFSSIPGALTSFKMSELQLRLRYAPQEKIYQTKQRRRTMEAFNPVFELAHTTGFKGILNADYNHNLTEFSFFKRFNLSFMGHADVRISAGAEWDQVPYMLLPMASTNQAYLIVPGSFALMRPLEFMYDRYANWDLTWHMNGLILNRIPLLKKLKLREVVTFKGVFGALTEKNNPAYHSQLIPFPGKSKPMGSRPYMEVGIGLDNILKIFRLDYVRRISYNSNSDADQWGLLFGVEFKF